MPYGLVVPDVPRGTFRAPVSLRNGALVTYPFVSPTPEGSRDPARAGALTSHARAGFSLPRCLQKTTASRVRRRQKRLS